MLPTRNITLSELQRCKRQFVTVHKKAIVLGTTEKGNVDWSEESVAQKFVEYLEENLKPWADILAWTAPQARAARQKDAYLLCNVNGGYTKANTDMNVHVDSVDGDCWPPPNGNCRNNESFTLKSLEYVTRYLTIPIIATTYTSLYHGFLAAERQKTKPPGAITR